MEDSWQPLTPMAAPVKNATSEELGRNGTGARIGVSGPSSSVTVETPFKGLSARTLENLKEKTFGTFKQNALGKSKLGSLLATKQGGSNISLPIKENIPRNATSSPTIEIVRDPKQRRFHLASEKVRVNMLSEQAKNISSELSKNLSSDQVNYMCNEQPRSKVSERSKAISKEHHSSILSCEQLRDSNVSSTNNSPRSSSTKPKPTFLQRVQKCVWFRSREDQNIENAIENHHCKEMPITQWIYRRIRRLLFFNKKKDPEFEDIELAPLRYRPVRLDQLCKATKFTKEELQFMYRGFKQECPTGVISEETFKSVYGKFFPICGLPDDGSGRSKSWHFSVLINTNTPMYAHYVFGTMDHEGTGQITFGEFIMGLSVLLKGSLQERINWVFNLYDINNDGYITKEELVDIVTSIYDLMGDDTHPTIDDIAAVEHVERLFDKLDLNRDGVVTIDEFMEYCMKNEDVIASMNCFNKA